MSDTAQFSFAGFVERIDAGVVSGWGSNISEPRSPTYVTIYVDGQRVGRAWCETLRPDAEQAGYPGARAFNFDAKRFLGADDRAIRLDVGFEDLPQLLPSAVMTEQATDRDDRIAAPGSAVDQRKGGRVLRWWESDYVVRQINRRVCGSPLAGVSSARS